MAKKIKWVVPSLQLLDRNGFAQSFIGETAPPCNSGSTWVCIGGGAPYTCSNCTAGASYLAPD